MNISSLNNHNDFDRTRCFSSEQVSEIIKEDFRTALWINYFIFMLIFAVLSLPTAFLTHFQQPRKLTKKKSKTHKISKSLKPELTLNSVWHNKKNDNLCLVFSKQNTCLSDWWLSSSYMNKYRLGKRNKPRKQNNSSIKPQPYIVFNLYSDIGTVKILHYFPRLSKRPGGYMVRWTWSSHVARHWSWFTTLSVRLITGVSRLRRIFIIWTEGRGAR